jgi:hypothetical protein
MGWEDCTCGKAWMVVGPLPQCPTHGNPVAAVRKPIFSAPLPDDWMRVAPGTDAAIWRPWSRETGEL